MLSTGCEEKTNHTGKVNRFIEKGFAADKGIGCIAGVPIVLCLVSEWWQFK